MKSLLAFSAALALVGCGGTSTIGTSAGRTTGTTAGSGSGNGNGNGNAATTGDASSSAAGSTGGCKANGAYDFNDPTTCCSGEANSSGICQAASTGGSGTTTGTPGTTAVGSTVGGTCPQNMPDINGGVGYVVDGGSCSELGCPNGFNCENGSCVLHGQNGGLQVTLSFDDPEDIDLHVEEPNGKTVWYSHRSGSDVAGSLDLDANAGCSINNPIVNIENVIYPDTGIPPGTYNVYVDYWERCDSKSSVNVGVQVRRDGAVYKYCGALTGSGDRCSSAVCGQLVTSFTYP